MVRWPGVCISYTDTMLPRETLERFDAYLGGRGLAFEAVIVGGAALGEPWRSEQDANPGWSSHVRATLEDLQRRPGVNGV